MKKQPKPKAAPQTPKAVEPILTRGEKLVMAMCFLAVAAVLLYIFLGTPEASQPIIIYKDANSGYTVVTSVSAYSAVSYTEVTSQFKKINVNTDGVERLTELDGIGPVRAQAIIDYRTLHGKFLSAEDLLNVEGIGEKTLEKFKEKICF